MTVALSILPGWAIYSPPINIAYLNAYLKSHGYEVTSLDFNIETYNKGPKYKSLWEIPRLGWAPGDVNLNKFFENEVKKWAKRLLDTGANIIGFSLYEHSKPLCLAVAKLIKQQDNSRIIVFGGPSCMRGEHLNYVLKGDVDAIVLGEGEETFLQFVKTVEKNGIKYCEGTIIKKDGKIIDCGDRSPIQNLDEIPFPYFSDLPRSMYLDKETITILATRGCTHKCLFCSDHLFWKCFRLRGVKNIFEEMKLRFDNGYRSFDFCDLAINNDIKLLDSLCDLIINSDLKGKIRCGSAICSRPDMSASLIKKMKEAGFMDLSLGVESGSQEILNRMRKGYKIETIEKNLRDFYNVGIKVKINLIVGFPGENEKTINKTMEFLSRNHKYIAGISSVGPLGLRPGSPVCTDSQKHGIFINEQDGNWQTKDGKNTAMWRTEQAHKIYMKAYSLGIDVMFSEIDRYYIPMLEYYMRNSNYKKMYETAIEALKHMNDKVERRPKIQ